MEKTCNHCQSVFQVTENDREFYNKISPLFNKKKAIIPDPTICPDCRQQRRLSWRNDRNLYHRSCDATEKRIISTYSPDKEIVVYENNHWWSDKWDALEYGREFDFSRPFFEQFNEHQKAVPHPALAVIKTSLENSEFCNQVGMLKNCYLIFDSRFSENCYYGKTIERCKDCLDCYKAFDCEKGYELDNCYNCYNCTYLWNTSNSSDCHYSANLTGCKNCFGCVNLQGKEWYFFNQPCTEEQWKTSVQDYLSSNSREEILKTFLDFRAQLPSKRMQERNCENSTGDYLYNCKNSQDCFDSEYLEDCRYCYDLKRDGGINYACYDVTHFGGSLTQCYESLSIGNGAQKTLFSSNAWSSNDSYYCKVSQNLKDCFACISLKNKQYCIFNKQYTKEEYHELMGKITEHMKKTGEWGEFFPSSISPYAYNETLAQEYFPQDKTETLQKGLDWKEKDNTAGYQGPQYSPPESIDEVSNDIIEKILVCETSNRPYKIIKEELEFYRQKNLPIPKKCPDQRHTERLARRNPRQLWDRNCDKCQKDIQTSYSPERPEKVYCEECYLKEVY